MKKHNGMRPQDILIVLKLISDKAVSSNNKMIASSLRLSEAEVSESLQRSAYAGLLSDIKNRKVNKKAFLDFLLNGIKYVFPTKPGALVRGVPTAHSALPLKESIVSEELFVWESPEGSQRGQAIEPLYHTIPYFIQNDINLYALLALVDAVRTGSARIITIASKELEKRILS